MPTASPDMWRKLDLTTLKLLKQTSSNSLLDPPESVAATEEKWIECVELVVPKHSLLANKINTVTRVTLHPLLQSSNVYCRLFSMFSKR